VRRLAELRALTRFKCKKNKNASVHVLLHSSRDENLSSVSSCVRGSRMATVLVEGQSGARTLFDDLDAPSTVGRPTTRTAEADSNPLDPLLPAVGARPEGSPRQRTAASTVAARGGRSDVVCDGG